MTRGPEGRFVRFGLVGMALGALAATGAASAQTGLIPLYEFIELNAEGGGQTRAYAINDTGHVIGYVHAGELRHSAHWHNRVYTDLHGMVHFDLAHPLFSGDYSEAFAISNSGQIVGTARTTIDCPPEFVITNAFVVRPAVLTDLATPYPGDALANLMTLGNPCLTAYDSTATGISNANHVVGWADREDGVIHAFLVTPQGGQFVRDSDHDVVNDLLIDLGTLAASDPVSSATAVNDAGEVTGYSYTITTGGLSGYHAFKLTPIDSDGDGAPDQWFKDINGYQTFQASIDAGGTGVNILMTDLGTLGGPNSWGRAINNAGQVVGESDLYTADGEYFTRAALWSDGLITDLGTLRSDRSKGFSAASGINSKGQIVGWAENDNRERRAFIYENGTMTDLNTLLFLRNESGATIIPDIVLTEARDINEDGSIVGWGTLRGNPNETRGFLLNPILVDPALLEPPEETDEDIPTGPDARGSYTSKTDFGPPGGTSPGGTGGPTDNGTPTPAAPSLCGASVASVVPIMLLGLWWIKLTRRGRA